MSMNTKQFELIGEHRLPRKGEWYVKLDGNLKCAPSDYIYAEFDIVRLLDGVYDNTKTMSRELYREGEVSLAIPYNAISLRALIPWGMHPDIPANRQQNERRTTVKVKGTVVKGFKPIKLEIMIESEEELKDLIEDMESAGGVSYECISEKDSNLSAVCNRIMYAVKFPKEEE